MRTLLEISDDMLRLQRALDEAEGEQQTLEALAALDAWLSSLDAEHKDKVDNYIAVIRNLEHHASVREAEAMRMADLAKSDQRKADALRQRLIAHFSAHDIKRLDTRRFRVTLCNNSVQPLIIDCDPDPERLPKQYLRVRHDFDRDAIRNDLKQGKALTFARFGERGQHLRIR